MVAALQRLLVEVRGAELAVLNTNQGYGQVFERIMSLWEEVLRGEVVEALWQYGEQEAEADRTYAAVQYFEQTLDACDKVCADSKELRDRVLAMRRVVAKAVGGDDKVIDQMLAKKRLADSLKQQGGAYEEALALYQEALQLYTEVCFHYRSTNVCSQCECI
jgi:tetratricopeptide (TPR) repeat protein